MRIVFLGTPAFAIPSLRGLMDRHEVVAVITRPDRPAGRGMAMRRSAVAELAAGRGLALLQPDRVREPAVVAHVVDLAPDVLVVAAYGQILPRPLLDAAPHGAVNVHASLLPRWRGASPVAAAILAGDDRTGVSIMRLEEGLDTGPVALQRSVAILPDDTTGSLTARLAELGARALLDALDEVAVGRATFKPQPAAGVTHAGLVKKSDGDIGWDRPAAAIARALRAYDPWPGVRLPLRGEPVRVLAGRALPAWTAGHPGDYARGRRDLKVSGG